MKRGATSRVAFVWAGIATATLAPPTALAHPDEHDEAPMPSVHTIPATYPEVIVELGLKTAAAKVAIEHAKPIDVLAIAMRMKDLAGALPPRAAERPPEVVAAVAARAVALQDHCDTLFAEAANRDLPRLRAALAVVEADAAALAALGAPPR